jgi:hypothetical protein
VYSPTASHESPEEHDTDATDVSIPPETPGIVSNDQLVPFQTPATGPASEPLM